MDKTKGVMDLDELFGRNDPIVVRWQGHEFSLKRPEALGPEDFARLGKLQAQFQALKTDAELTGESAGQLQAALDQMLAMLAPDLAHSLTPLPFIAKVRVLDFYARQLAPSDAEKKAAPPAAAS